MDIQLSTNDGRTEPRRVPAYVIGSDRPDHLVGRVLTIIEAIGLPEKQEKSLKDVLRTEIYSTILGGQESWISSELHTIIKDFEKKYAEQTANRPTNSENIGYMEGEFLVAYKE